jgi:hypothetical protein
MNKIDRKYGLGTTALMRDILQELVDQVIAEERPGLWANIRAKRARGEKPAHKNSKAHKDAVAAGKKINKDS